MPFAQTPLFEYADLSVVLSTQSGNQSTDCSEVEHVFCGKSEWDLPPASKACDWHSQVTSEPGIRSAAVLASVLPARALKLGGMGTSAGSLSKL